MRIMATREGGDSVQGGEEGCPSEKASKGAQNLGGCRQARGRAEGLDER